MSFLVACGGGSVTIGDTDGGDAAINPDASGGNDANQNDVVNPGDASDAATFDVKGVNGLALWLKSDIGVTADGTGIVSIWADQSGNGNDAKETRAGLQPKLMPSGINALPTIHFASAPCNTSGCSGFVGNDLLIADSVSLEWATGDFLVEVVARYTNDPASQTHDAFGMLYASIYGPPNMATTGLGLYANVWKEPNDLATSSGIEAYVGGQPPATSSATGYNNDMPHVFAMQRVGTTLSVRIDGVSAGSTTIASVDVGKTGGRLGGCENATAQRLEGDISEVIAVKGTIAGSDLAGIEGYLKSRYATP